MKRRTEIINAIVDKIMKGEAFNFNHDGEAVNFISGYMVGGFHKCIKVAYKLHRDFIVDGVSEMFDLFTGGDFNHEYLLGTWVKNGFLYLDISKNIKQLDEARWTGFRNNQVAIYDIVNKQEIKI